MTETATRRARVAGASHVNLRSGPGISFPPVTILENGEEVQVEKLEGGTWYRVSLPDGLRGYVYAELIHFLPEPAEPQPEEAEPTASPSTPTIEVSLEDSTAKSEPEISEPEPPEPTVEQPEEILSAAKEPQVEVAVVNPPPSQPVINNTSPKTAAVVPRKIDTTVPLKASQGRFWRILSWILAPSCIFILGWILGGNYYLRRDRIERTKLRF